MPNKSRNLESYSKDIILGNHRSLEIDKFENHGKYVDREIQKIRLIHIQNLESEINIYKNRKWECGNMVQYLSDNMEWKFGI